MLVEWLNNSTLLDFEARIITGQFLSKFFDRERQTLAARVRNVVQHYSYFMKHICSQNKSTRESAEKELNDFIRIVQYNDLNIWSIKQSTQQAHAQLNRILKNFKVSFYKYFSCMVSSTYSSANDIVKFKSLAKL